MRAFMGWTGALEFEEPLLSQNTVHKMSTLPGTAIMPGTPTDAFLEAL